MIRRSTKEKLAFIIEYMKEQSGFMVTIFDEELVDAYIEKFKVKFDFKMWGAHICPNLSAMLKLGYKMTLFGRGRSGMSGGPGFPKWYYCYWLNESYRRTTLFPELRKESK